MKSVVPMFVLFALDTGAHGADRLESVENDLTVTELHRAYHKLWDRKLLRQDAMVQFVSAPGGSGNEFSISISDRPHADRSKQRQFDLTVKEASSSLWSVVVARHEGTSQAKHIKVKTCKVPLPESTALAVHRAWLAMLRRIDPAPNHFVLDSTREIFLGRTADGRLLRGRLPVAKLRGNNKTLLEIVDLLYRSCGASDDDRVRDFRRVEGLANAILGNSGR